MIARKLFITVAFFHFAATAQTPLWIQPRPADPVVHGDSIQALSFTHDGAQLLSDDHWRIGVWNVITGGNVLVINKSSTARMQIASRDAQITSNSGYIDRYRDELQVALDDKSVFSGGRIWSLNSGQLTETVAPTGFPQNPCISPNWDIYITSLPPTTNIATLRTVTNSEILLPLWQTNSYEAQAYAFSSDGQLVATTSSFLRDYYDTHDRSVTVWDSATGAFVKVFFGQSANPYQLRFSTDGKYIASVAETFNGHACVWDYQSGKLLLSLKKPDPRSAAFTFLPNTDLVAFGHDDGIQIWNIQSSNLVKTITGMATNISALAGSPDGRKLAAGRLDGSVMFYNLEGLWDLRIRTTSESGSYVITFNAMPSSRYTLLSSTDLRTWSSRTNIPPASTSSQVQLPITSSDPTQFFQLIQE